MKFLIADTFTRSLARLDGQSQGLVKQAAFDFQVTPASPGFHFHKLDRARDKGFWSFRVNQDVRIIVHRGESSLVLCYADHHDAAYAWAEVRRIEVHPQTGAAQIVEVKERIEEVVRQVEREPPLFAKHEPDYLLALGVPAEWIDAVRTIGESGLEKLYAHLPAEAAERLLQLACGEPVARPVTVKTADPFQHPDAQRRFRVLDSHDELRRALDYPWDQWIVFLHPAQRAVVERRFKGPARVSGSAGTGKSVVGLHRAARLLATNVPGRVLLTTYSKTLAARLSQSMDLLVAPSSKERRRLDIDPLHKVARDLWTQRTGKTFSAVDSKLLNDLLAAAKTRAAPAADFSLAFLRSEWDAVIDPWGIRTWTSYKGVSRTGRSTPLGAKQRLALWKVFEEAQRLLADRRLMTWSGLCYAAATLSYDKRPFVHVVADESQDFGAAELTLLRALVEPGDDDLFLCGDAGQRIFRTPVAWSAVGMDVRGRSSRLTINYRTTEQIRRFADAILPEVIEEADGEKEKRSTVSVLSGPAPDVHGFDGVSKETDGVARWIKALLDEGYKPQDVAIFARTEGVLRDRAVPALEKAGLTGHHLNDDQPPSAADASLGTMHRAKGLEFKVVVVMGCDADVLPLAYALKDMADDADKDAFLEQERQLLYVACTRARERLLVSFAGKPCRWLQG